MSLTITTTECPNMVPSVQIGLTKFHEKKWTQAFDGGYHCEHMTTDLVECMKLVLKGVCNLSIIALLRLAYFLLAKLFARKSREAYARRAIGNIFLEATMTQVQEN